MRLLGAASGAHFEIVGGTAALPDGLLEDSRLVIEDGKIVEVSGASSRKAGPAKYLVDAHSCWVLPGAVDIHGDGLEQQIRPRPRAEMPLQHALHASDRMLTAAGVTTSFHAIKFSDDPARERTIEGAKEITKAITDYQASGENLVDHFVLHRLDIRMSGSWEALSPSLSWSKFPYVSVDDNQPGQGQLRDIERYAERIQPRLTALGITVEEYLESQMKEDPETISRNLCGLREASETKALTIASHDDDSPQQVRNRRALGCTVSEFPVTEEASLTARDLGMPTVLGAPNALRGSSTANNVSARRLLELDAVSVLCSDYSPWSLWWTAFQLSSEGLLSLTELTRMVSLNPARAVGLLDRGALAGGLRADILIVRLARGVPRIEAVFSAGRLAYVA